MIKLFSFIYFFLLLIPSSIAKSDSLLCTLQRTYNSYDDISQLNQNQVNKIKEEIGEIIFFNRNSGDVIRKMKIPESTFTQDENIQFKDSLRLKMVQKEEQYSEVVCNGRYLIITERLVYYNSPTSAEGSAPIRKKIYDSGGSLIVVLDACEDEIYFSPINDVFIVSSNYACNDSLWFYGADGKLISQSVIPDGLYNMQFSTDGKQFKCWDNSINSLYLFEVTGKLIFHFDYGKVFKSPLINFFTSSRNPTQLYLNLFDNSLILADTTGKISWKRSNIAALDGFINDRVDCLVFSARDLSSGLDYLIVIDKRTGAVLCKMNDEKIIAGFEHTLLTKKGNVFFEYEY